MTYNGNTYAGERPPFPITPDSLTWPHFERNLSMERRVTILEIHQERNHERIESWISPF